MRTLSLIAVLMVAATTARADRPAVIALSSMTGVTVKLTESASYQPGSSLSYEITHWPDGAILASGIVKGEAMRFDSRGLYSFSIDGLSPKLWSPQTPELYEVSVSHEAGRLLGKTRFGFRKFEAKGDRFYLNGRPIFLRSVPINPPGRDLPVETGNDPQFIRGYLKLLKSAHVNIIRTDAQHWQDVCDELGIMVFTGRYGPAPGGKGPVAPPLEKTLPYYRDLVLGLASHPSNVIYVLTNEVDYKSPGSTNKQLLTAVREDIRLVDPTRPVIGNAGFGHGEPGEIFDIHPYTGWYHANICDWCDIFSRYHALATKAGQPLTLSECVGAYTCDAGDFETMSKQLCTMMKWVGTSRDPRSAALEYQAELVRQVVEIGRRYSSSVGTVAGIMPFTYFLGWSRAAQPEDLIIKPAFETLRTVYQPILISPECWRRNLYAGEHLKVRLCVSNDDDLGRNLPKSTATVDLVDARGRKLAAKNANFPAIAHYSKAWSYVSIPLPKTLPKGYYEVRCRLIADGKEASHNSFPISIAPRTWVKAPSKSVTLYDPSGGTARAFKALGIRFTLISSLSNLPKGGVVVIGEGALAAGRYPDRNAVLAFLSRGVRILCLRQDVETWNSDWLPAQFRMHRRSYTYIQPVGGNASIMDGLSDRDLRFWNELGRLPNGNPDVYPAVGAFYPKSVEDLRHARVWASCDQLLGAAALLEIAHGPGSILLSQFKLTERAGGDPIADKLLSNLISYATSGKAAGPVDLSKPVRWNHDAFRSGVFVSPLQGFLPHSPVYEHDGSSKGLLGADHRIDGFTLVGNYGFKGTGWLTPIPDPAAEGWGIAYGTLSRPATRFVLKLRNTGDTPAAIALKVDGKPVGVAQSVQPGAEQTLDWAISRSAGPLKLELRGDQRLVITESHFE